MAITKSPPTNHLRLKPINHASKEEDGCDSQLNDMRKGCDIGFSLHSLISKRSPRLMAMIALHFDCYVFRIAMGSTLQGCMNIWIGDTSDF
jgi:hypothetical protein